MLRFPSDVGHGSGTRSISPRELGWVLRGRDEEDVGVGPGRCP